MKNFRTMKLCDLSQLGRQKRCRQRQSSEFFFVKKSALISCPIDRELMQHLFYCVPPSSIQFQVVVIKNGHDQIKQTFQTNQTFHSRPISSIFTLEYNVLLTVRVSKKKSTCKVFPFSTKLILSFFCEIDYRKIFFFKRNQKYISRFQTLCWI